MLDELLELKEIGPRPGRDTDALAAVQHHSLLRGCQSLPCLPRCRIGDFEAVGLVEDVECRFVDGIELLEDFDDRLDLLLVVLVAAVDDVQ